MLFCLAAFQVSFYCPGTKEGEVDMTFSLNYTRIESGSVETDETKTFVLVVRRLCQKTGRCVDMLTVFSSLELQRTRAYM